MQLLLQNDDYKICEEFDNDGNRYFLCLPIADASEYRICCSLNDDYLPLGEAILKASNIYANVSKKNKKLVYAHMILDTGELQEAAKDNDNPLYTVLLKKVSSMIKDTYQVIIKEKVAAIDPKVSFISQSEDDAKFIDWIEINQALPVERIVLGTDFNHRVDDFEPETPFIKPIENKNNDEENEYMDEKPLVKTLKPAINNNGFSNIVLVIITLAAVLALCIGAVYMLTK